MAAVPSTAPSTVAMACSTIEPAVEQNGSETLTTSGSAANIPEPHSLRRGTRPRKPMVKGSPEIKIGRKRRATEISDCGEPSRNAKVRRFIIPQDSTTMALCPLGRVDCIDPCCSAPVTFGEAVDIENSVEEARGDCDPVKYWLLWMMAHDRCVEFLKATGKYTVAVMCRGCKKTKLLDIDQAFRWLKHKQICELLNAMASQEIEDGHVLTTKDIWRLVSLSLNKHLESSTKIAMT